LENPHRDARVLAAGAPPAEARAAVILVHGRGATAESMLPLADAFGRDDIAYLAPQAVGGSWYPQSFLAPIAANEPWLSAALAMLAGLLDRLAEEGLGPARVGVAGFSQGACLATEFVARNARRYGCVIAFSGGLIGPPGHPRNYRGSLAGTPIFLGCSDVDPHVPLARVEETAAVLAGLGAKVEKRIYPGMAHTVNDDEIAAARALLANMVADIGA
jgi:predicted esterase